MIEVDRSITGYRVVAVLALLMAMKGKTDIPDNRATSDSNVGRSLRKRNALGSAHGYRYA